MHYRGNWHSVRIINKTKYWPTCRGSLAYSRMPFSSHSIRILIAAVCYKLSKVDFHPVFSSGRQHCSYKHLSRIWRFIQYIIKSLTVACTLVSRLGRLCSSSYLHSWPSLSAWCHPHHHHPPHPRLPLLTLGFLLRSPLPIQLLPLPCFRRSRRILSLSRPDRCLASIRRGGLQVHSDRTSQPKESPHAIHRSWI